MMWKDYITSPPEFNFMKDSITITNDLLNSIENDLIETRQYVNTKKDNNDQMKEMMRLLQDDNIVLTDKVTNLEHLLFEQNDQWKHRNTIISEECNELLLTNQSEMERVILQCNDAINEKNDIIIQLKQTEELCNKVSNELDLSKDLIQQNKQTIDYLTQQNREYALALTAALQRCSELERQVVGDTTLKPSSITTTATNVYTINNEYNYLHNNHHANILKDSVETHSSIMHHKPVITNAIITIPQQEHSSIHHKPIIVNNSFNTIPQQQQVDYKVGSSNYIQPIKSSINNMTRNVAERQLVSPADDIDAIEGYEYREEYNLETAATKSVTTSSKEVHENIQSEPLEYQSSLSLRLSSNIENYTNHNPNPNPRYDTNQQFDDTTEDDPNSVHDTNISEENKQQDHDNFDLNDNNHTNCYEYDAHIDDYTSNVPGLVSDQYGLDDTQEPFETSYYDADPYNDDDNNDIEDSYSENYEEDSLGEQYDEYAHDIPTTNIDMNNDSEVNHIEIHHQDNEYFEYYPEEEEDDEQQFNAKNSSIYEMVENDCDLEQLNLEELSMLSL